MSFLQRIDAAVYRAERFVVAWAMVAMGLVVALDVVSSIATRQNGFVERTLRDLLPDTAASAAGPLATAVLVITGLVLAYGVCRVRGMTSRPRALGVAALATGVLWAAMEGYARLLPNGIPWSQTLGLALMVWAGFVGASLAARDRRHLSLEVGPRLFPARARKYVVALGHLVTAAFCAVLLVLAAWSVSQHFTDWTTTGYEGGTFPTLPIPRWIAYLAIPYGLAVMALRFLGDSAAALRGQETGGDEVAAFKKMGGLDE